MSWTYWSCISWWTLAWSIWGKRQWGTLPVIHGGSRAWYKVGEDVFSIAAEWHGSRRVLVQMWPGRLALVATTKQGDGWWECGLHHGMALDEDLQHSSSICSRWDLPCAFMVFLAPRLQICISAGPGGPARGEKASPLGHWACYILELTDTILVGTPAWWLLGQDVVRLCRGVRGPT